MEGDDCPRRSPWLSECYVTDGTRATQNTDAALASACEVGHAVDDVATVRDLHYMRPEGVGAIPGYYNRWFGLVLGSRGPPPRSSLNLLSSSSTTTAASVGGSFIPSTTTSGSGVVTISLEAVGGLDLAAAAALLGSVRGWRLLLVLDLEVVGVLLLLVVRRLLLVVEGVVVVVELMKRV